MAVVLVDIFVEKLTKHLTAGRRRSYSNETKRTATCCQMGWSDWKVHEISRQKRIGTKGRDGKCLLRARSWHSSFYQAIYRRRPFSPSSHVRNERQLISVLTSVQTSGVDIAWLSVVGNSAFTLDTIKTKFFFCTRWTCNFNGDTKTLRFQKSKISPMYLVG